MTPPNPPELRIACVMNGGVSLAVWMAGVTHELDLLRRATLDEGAAEADIPAYDQALWQRWRDAARGRRVVVDIVAGTSAGGINGTLLATAAAGGGRLDWPDESRGPFLRNLWEQEAGLDTLLPPPDDRTPRSLLKGGHLDEVITKTLERVAEENGRRRENTGPAPHPVTLFVTATALGESDEEYRDGFDQEFRAQDHRRRYRFRYDPDHVEYTDRHTFDENRELSDFVRYPAALARATRASASYPLAFEPVLETADMRRPPVRTQPAWAADNSSWLADGGILDNSPFGPVLQEIAHRAPDADVERLLVYVVPSRGTPPGGETSDETVAEAPDWSAVLGSALRFPSEADFRDDIAEVRELLFTANVQQQAVRLFCASAHGSGSSDAGRTLVDGAMALLPTYWRGRVAGRIREARTLAEESGTRRAPRRLSAPEDVLKIDDALRHLPADQQGAPQPVFDRTGSLLDVPWQWGVGAGERCARLFARDVMDHLAQGAPIEAQAKCLADALRRIQALSEALDKALSALEPEQLTDIATARELVEQTANGLEVPLRMQELMHEAAGQYATAVRALGTTVSADDVARVALAVEICDRAIRAGTPYERVPRFTFLRLGPDVDAPGLSGVAGDGALGTALGDRKLYGIRAGHFAAFARAEWRRHDWLWGRLDAIAHLGRALLAGADEDEITSWISDSQQLALVNEVGGPSMQELWETTSNLVGTSDEALLDQVSQGGSGLVRDIEKRAARMLADEFDIKLIPESAERSLVKWLLRKLIKRVGASEAPVG
jgi:predicted acylesterase/phospholipase RssA